jgi:hypothetical protein
MRLNATPQPHIQIPASLDPVTQIDVHPAPHDLVYQTQEALTLSRAIERGFGTLSRLLPVCNTIAEEIFETYVEERRERRRNIGARVGLSGALYR